MADLVYDFGSVDGGAVSSGAKQGRYSISELAEHFGLTLRTLRFYEEKDLLRPVRRNSRRIYLQRDFDILTDIVRMKAIGMTIAEIRSIIDLVRSGQVANGEKLAVKIASKREKEIEKQIKTLREASLEATGLIDAIESRVGWFKTS
ncbi:MAG: MerR family transcriptional regulator [Rhodobiaceae bacterium]|nr:MerR family transcriptional regulator [Rhodobiaceae bacterium]